MAFLSRLWKRSEATKAPTRAAPHTATPARPSASHVSVLGGHETLEVVGESFYQDALWRIVGSRGGSRVRAPVIAVLRQEPKNPEDCNAIEVRIEGLLVGHLSRADAASYLSGLQTLERRSGGPVRLRGVIVGGGAESGSRGMLGVFLDHDPTDFGVHPHHVPYTGELRTGLSEAISTDEQDDSYDLSWLGRLSGDHSPRDITTLRNLLEVERDPIDRHFMHSELVKCLYKSRAAFGSALSEFDAACERHHSEMDVIRPALLSKFGCVPLIEMYRQAAIRHQKAHDWTAVVMWSERGLAVYATQAARVEAVDDLEKRRDHAHAKLAPAPSVQRRPGPISTSGPSSSLEELLCGTCGATFVRERSRGRKPLRCPTCRGEGDPDRVVPVAP